jgi:hypothetical protein
VYKKLRDLNKDVWCDKVASTKLTDPKRTYKLPFSLSKRLKGEEGWREILKNNNTLMKKKTQALVIHSIQ